MIKKDKLYGILNPVRRNNMTTEERISPRVISIFCIILGLVFCSCVVSYKFVDIVYFLVVLGFMLSYINLKRVK